MYIIGKRLSTGGVFHFSTNPALHTTYSAAVVEATRLARTATGWEFCIFTLTEGLVVEPVVKVTRKGYTT